MRRALTILMLAAGSAYAQRAGSEADARLNAAYRDLVARLDAPAQQRLREAQRAWIAFRDKECAFRRPGGAACVDQLSDERTEQLREQIDALPAPVTGAGSCAARIGAAAAAAKVRQCIQVSPASRPPCNAANACELIDDEIQRGCAILGKDAPAFCPR